MAQGLSFVWYEWMHDANLRQRMVKPYPDKHIQTRAYSVGYTMHADKPNSKVHGDNMGPSLGREDRIKILCLIEVLFQYLFTLCIIEYQSGCMKLCKSNPALMKNRYDEYYLLIIGYYALVMTVGLDPWNPCYVHLICLFSGTAGRSGCNYKNAMFSYRNVSQNREVTRWSFTMLV